MPVEYKPLIEDVNNEQFSKFFSIFQALAEQEYGTGASTLGGILDKGYYAIINSVADDNFRDFASAGYNAAMMELASAKDHTDAQLVLLRHLTIGMSIGFKYASYLHEQRELASPSTERSEVTKAEAAEELLEEGRE